MTTCFHKYTPPEGQTQVIARAQSISLIRCLFRLVKCKFTEPLYKSAWYTLLSLLIFSTYALSIKREGHNLKKKKKKGNIAVAAVVAFLCGYALKSAVLRYCGYRDSPMHGQVHVSHMALKKSLSGSCGLVLWIMSIHDLELHALCNILFCKNQCDQ